MLRIIVGVLIGLMAVSCNNNNAATDTAQQNDTSAAPADTAKYGEMKTYYMVFLHRGPNRNQDSATAARLQQAHLANIDRLASEGKIIMAGPMGSKTSLRGIFIMDCKDSTEAASYIKTDSAIITGRLRFEIHPWWTAMGRYEFK